MKARKVKGLDPTAPLADNARAHRRACALDELCSASCRRAQDPATVEALHDMRIAAKRLRYVLELDRAVLRPVRGDGASSTLKELQDLLGEIHDCDVHAAAVASCSTRCAEAPRPPGDAGARRRPPGHALRGAVALQVADLRPPRALFERFLALLARARAQGLPRPARVRRDRTFDRPVHGADASEPIRDRCHPHAAIEAGAAVRRPSAADLERPEPLLQPRAVVAGRSTSACSSSPRTPAVPLLER